MCCGACVGRREVAAARCVDGMRSEGYDGWVWGSDRICAWEGVFGNELFVGEEARGEGLLEVGDSCEGC